MERIFKILRDSPLFYGISFNDFQRVIACLSVKTKFYKKNEFIFFSGDKVNFIGLIISGGVKIVKEDIEGNITILTELSASEMFGEVFACAGILQSPVTVQAAEDTEIMFIDYKKIIAPCSNACYFHSDIIKNMLKTIAQKNLMLNQKIEILSKRTTREKLLCFFDLQRGSAKKFTIPFDREELSNYLSVDRSAMSNELCKMRDEGLIRFQKNNFEILSIERP